jgi:rfaE bifunctional protein kinase chain/domain
MAVDNAEILDFLKNKADRCRILVVGDLMLDQYFYGTVTRISPEAPVPVNLVKGIRNKLGGAANVAHNLSRLGCQVSISGAIGDDDHGHVLRSLLSELSVDQRGIIRTENRTITKIRVLGGHQQMLRLDFEDKEDLSREQEMDTMKLIHDMLADQVNGIILSDYNKGFCTPGLCQQVIHAAHDRNIPVFVDPKGVNWDKYDGADCITPNVKELSDIIGHPVNNEDEDVVQAARKIMEKYHLPRMVVTRSEKGMTVLSDTTEHTIPTEAKEVFDVSGAGDTVLAAFAAGVTGGLSPEMAASMANRAAGIGVGKVGTYAVSREEIIESLQ